ncbi:TetR-like C-terminal domain-containing protein [Niallia sp. Krafla_26]|uniref:TetR-like C-terminal domain-containing protein n=1 Tax=Niallia sp. Krafla_26 TaxID=3064703 RepID=UPI003D16D758
MHIVHEITFKKWMSLTHNDEEIFQYISIFVVSGSIQVIRSWLDQGMDKSPQEMAVIINNFANKGLSFLR